MIHSSKLLCRLSKTFIQAANKIPGTSRHPELPRKEVSFLRFSSWSEAHTYSSSTVAVALWAMEPNTTISPNLTLEVDGVFEGGVGGILTNNPTWTKRSAS